MQARFVDTRQLARLCDVSGLLVVAAAIYVFSFNFFWEELGGYGFSFAELSTEYWLTVGIAWLAAAVMVGVAGWRDAGRRSGQIWWEAGALAAMGLTAAAMWLGLAFGGQWMWWVFNLVMLTGVLAMIAAGYRWNRAWPINLAVAIFSITLFTRYFEFGFGLLGQSVAFIVAGIILLGRRVRNGVSAQAIGGTDTSGGCGSMSRRMTILFFAVVVAQVVGLVAFAGARQVASDAGAGGHPANGSC